MNPVRMIIACAAYPFVGLAQWVVNLSQVVVELTKAFVDFPKRVVQSQYKNSCRTQSDMAAKYRIGHFPHLCIVILRWPLGTTHIVY
jgi:hypothetical protein